MPRSSWRIFTMALIFVIGSASCRKPEKSKSTKRLYEEAVVKSSQEQMALTKFTVALREILQWRQLQEALQSESQRQSMVKTLAEKMAAVPVDGLSPQLFNAWTPMLKAWKDLAANSAANTKLRQSGEKAAQELNRQLEARGIIDIRF